MTAMIAGGSRLKTPARFKSMRETTAAAQYWRLSDGNDLQ